MRKSDGLPCDRRSFEQAASFLSTLTGRTRSAFNVRPAPVPPGSAGSPVLDMNPAFGRAAFRFGATSHQTRKEIIMARSNTAPAQETNPPDFLAWHVANKGEKGFWTRIGAAWFHRDRKGLSLQLEVVPINGRIVLRAPLEDETKEVQPGA